MIERRYDPTLGEWRIFTDPHRDDADDAHCRFCPTVDPDRPTAIPVASYQLAVVDDPLPRPAHDGAPPGAPSHPVYRTRPAAGASEVVLYSDQHGKQLPDLSDQHVARLVDVWADRYAVLGARPDIAYVFVFENGAAGGPTGAHPYGQAHGYPEVPPLMARELQAAVAHQDEHGTCVFCDVVACERADGRRLIAQNDSFLAFVPFAARFPHEVHIYAQRHMTSLLDCTDPERLALARMLRLVTRTYRALTDPVVPYVLSLHQAPTDDGSWLPVSHLHVEVTALQPMAATEVGAGTFLSGSLPEDAAARLRSALRGQA